MTEQVEQATQMRTAGLAGHWLHQSEMWLAGLSSYGVPAEAINDLRQNARVAVHEAVEATERAALTVTPQEAAKVSAEDRENIVDEIESIICETHEMDVRDIDYAENIVSWLERHHPAALRAISEDS